MDQWLKKEQLSDTNNIPANLQDNSNLKDHKSTTNLLTDADYEFLFHQLLEGVVHGWHQQRIQKFFDKLGERGQPEYWVEWLKRFQTKVVSNANRDQQLGARLLRLAQEIQEVSSMKTMTAIVYETAHQILNTQNTNPILEYGGPDTSVVNQTIETEKDDSTENVSALSVEELFTLLQQDENLVTQMSQQLGIKTNDPQIIIATLINQLNNLNLETETDLATPTPVENEPPSVESLFKQGLTKAMQGDLSGAIITWEKALEIDPHFAPAWHNRGAALADLGQLEEANSSFEKAINLKPDDYEAWNNRGHVLYNLQRFSEALICWDQVIQINPNYYQAWYNRGCVLENLGQLEASFRSFEQTLAIEPSFSQAQEKIQNLLKKLPNNS